MFSDDFQVKKLPFNRYVLSVCTSKYPPVRTYFIEKMYIAEKTINRKMPVGYPQPGISP